MTMPTREEIEAAWREIDAAGPNAHDTAMLALAALRGNRMADAVRRMSEVYCTTLQIEAARAGLVQALVMGAVMTGLNYGLRIGDQRVAAALRREDGGDLMTGDDERDRGGVGKTDAK